MIIRRGKENVIPEIPVSLSQQALEELTVEKKSLRRASRLGNLSIGFISGSVFGILTEIATRDHLYAGVVSLIMGGINYVHYQREETEDIDKRIKNLKQTIKQ